MIGLRDIKTKKGNASETRNATNRKLSDELYFFRNKPKLPIEEILEFWRAYRATGDEVLRDALVDNYSELVVYFSERFFEKLPRHVDRNSVVSAATKGLIEAIEGFDVERGLKFETYASVKIRGSVLDELRSSDHMPRLVRKAYNGVGRVKSKLIERLGREPKGHEVAEALGISFVKYRELLSKFRGKISLEDFDNFQDSYNPENGSIHGRNGLPSRDDSPPSRDMEREEIWGVLARELTEKEYRALSLYYREGIPMKEVGARIGLSESRICQIHRELINSGRLQEMLTDYAPEGLNGE